MKVLVIKIKSALGAKFDHRDPSKPEVKLRDEVFHAMNDLLSLKTLFNIVEAGFKKEMLNFDACVV